MPSDERSNYPLCGAKKRNGELCRAFAGQGTDHPGTGRCKFHAGNTPSHKQAATIAEAKQRMIKLGAPMERVAPQTALVGILRATAGHVAWLHAQVGALEDLSDREARVMVELYDSERDRLTRIAKACLDAGISEFEVRVTQQHSDFLVRIVDNAVKAIDGWTDDQRKQFGAALRMELAYAAEPADEAP
jgi:hypothetical protein